MTAEKLRQSIERLTRELASVDMEKAELETEQKRIEHSMIPAFARFEGDKIDDSESFKQIRQVKRRLEDLSIKANALGPAIDQQRKALEKAELEQRRKACAHADAEFHVVLKNLTNSIRGLATTYAAVLAHVDQYAEQTGFEPAKNAFTRQLVEATIGVLKTRVPNFHAPGPNPGVYDEIQFDAPFTNFNQNGTNPMALTAKDMKDTKEEAA